MFARMVELTLKKDKLNELRDRFDSEILPLLRRQTGFTDELVLRADGNSERVVAISLWNTREDAERYHREHYPKIADILKPLLATNPTLQTFTVEVSTPHKISAKAA
ncbi:MAG TPA: antibiotic biosynthesis monooxygenase [Terriglobales bacterium]|nr:antibiotic biosynthesis monooxygenase [Terriglobales bacterium]